MYVPDEADRRLAEGRVTQFAEQTRRFLAGQLAEEDFRTLRLQNGLHIQRHAPMLRVAIPHGMLDTTQLRMLAHVARRWDRGYGHFSTRQSIEFQWPRLEDVPALLAELSTVRMHALQPPGNGMRHAAADRFAGIAPDEVINPLAWCELIRQWWLRHPELAFLPRNFRIAVSGARTGRAAVDPHDIGLQAVEREGQKGFSVRVGGGIGRTPIVGTLIHPFVPWPHLLTYLQATLQVYELHRRQDSKYRARIRALVRDLTPVVFADQVDQAWSRTRNGSDTLGEVHVEAIAARFTWPPYDPRAADVDDGSGPLASTHAGFARWLQDNVHGHRVPGYAAVSLSLRKAGVPPGDISADQMDAVADLADRHGFGELRVSQAQDLILADVRRDHLFPLWRKLDVLGLAMPEAGLSTRVMSGPGGEPCTLSDAIQERLEDLDHLFDLGDIDLDICRCIVRDPTPDEIERLVDTYLAHRDSEAERFIDVVDRLGSDVFRQAVQSQVLQTPCASAPGSRFGGF